MARESRARGRAPLPKAARAFEEGILVGVLIGEGHFGGDGRQPHVTLRMHTDHAALFAWIERAFPGGRLYGPYTHGGRSYYQWMARGTYLRERLLPLLERHLDRRLDAKSWNRFLAMKDRYGLGIPALPQARPRRRRLSEPAG